MKYHFQAKNASFNHDELKRLISSLNSTDFNKLSSIEVDLSPYAFMCLHETQYLLLILKYLKSITNSHVVIRLPDNPYVLSFLERWNFFKEIIEHYDEYFGKGTVTIGRRHNALEYINNIEKLERSKVYLSRKLLEITRIKKFADVTEYVSNSHSPELLSVLISQIGRDKDAVVEFVDIIVFELLKNIIHHVLAYDDSGNNSCFGFISLQTHEAIASDNKSIKIFENKWPSFLLPFISKCTHGIVELSVVDDGAGIGKTISKIYKSPDIHNSSNELERIRYAFKPGTSRYLTYTDNQYESEMLKLKELADKIKYMDPKHATDAIRNYENKLRSKHIDRDKVGYGLFLVLKKINEWNGVILVRSKDTFFSPTNIYFEDFYDINKSYDFPGVQIQILLPIPPKGIR